MMKVVRKLLGFCLTLAVILSLTMVNHTVVNAANYKVNIALGNNQNAQFNSEADKLGELSSDKRKLIISSDKVSKFTIDEIKAAITTTPEDPKATEKYVFDGLRVAGDDAKFSGSEIKVDEDQTFVVAYKICKIVPYTVEYRYETASGDTMDKVVAGAKAKDVLYAAVNEKVTVPALEVEGYVPDANSKELTLKDTDTDNKVVFTYTHLEEKTVYEEKTITKTVYGTPTYSYSYEYVEGQPVVKETTTPGRTVVNNRRVTNTPGQTQVADNTGNTADANASEQEAGEAGEITTIGEGETPKAGEATDNTKIPETETPKKGETDGTDGTITQPAGFSIILIVFLIIFILIAFIIVMYFIRRKSYK